MTRLKTPTSPTRFSRAVKRASQGKRFTIIGDDGKPAAALVPLEDAEFMQRLEDKMDIEAAEKALREPGGITLQALRKKLGI
jgi:antitoxin (DNA-binding transcriptional repressor) of toxin-antitoxin stability system